MLTKEQVDEMFTAGDSFNSQTLVEFITKAKSVELFDLSNLAASAHIPEETIRRELRNSLYTQLEYHIKTTLTDSADIFTLQMIGVL